MQTILIDENENVPTNCTYGSVQDKSEGTTQTNHGQTTFQDERKRREADPWGDTNSEHNLLAAE